MSEKEKKNKEHLFGKLLKTAGIKPVQLARLTGLSPSHISKFEKGDIQNASRNTLIFLSLYLCADRTETNKLLKSFKEEDIGREDYIYFIEAAYRRRISGVQTLFEGRLSFDTLLLGMERREGDEVLVHNKPSTRFMPEGYMTFKNNKRKLDDPIFNEIAEHIILHRRGQLETNLDKYSQHHMVCEHCFRNYVRRITEKEKEDEKKFIARHISNLIKAVEKHKNLRFSLIEECPFFSFEYKRKGKQKGKLFFVGKQEHEYTSKETPALHGFATDSPQLFDFFEKEYERLEKTITKESEEHYRNGTMAEHLTEICNGELGQYLNSFL